MTNNEILYTHKATPHSTAVEQVWYNYNTKELYLDLHNVVYRYSHVPVSVYNNLLNADSKGQYYRDEIRNYGPAARLGPAINLGTRVDNSPVAFRTEDDTEQFRVFRSGATATTSTAKTLTPQLSLAKDVDNSGYAHEFTFVINGSDEDRKQHTVKASSMDDAVERMFEFASLFNTDIVLKAVTVYFE
jgi:hypothetical protein